MRPTCVFALALLAVILVPTANFSQAGGQMESSRGVAGGGVSVPGPKYMNLNSHPHPYGLVIAGNDLGTDQQTYLYCAAYGNGNFIVRGFGPAPFQMNGPRGSADPAVNKAAGVGEPVTQEIAISVRGDKVECAINNKVVASYDKSALVTSGKLKSTDGVYGIRFAHNTEALVTGLTITKP